MFWVTVSNGHSITGMRTRAAAAFLTLTLSAGSMSGAQAPAFEVASVKVNNSGPESTNGYFPAPGRLRVTNMTLQGLIQSAYHIKTGMLFGVTGWMNSVRFDIDAKAPGQSSFDDDLMMLQALLAERFQLRFHRETRTLKMQVLEVAKGGPKFTATKDQEEKEHVTIRPTGISGTGIPFGHFVSILEAQVGYPILNQTGLTAHFDLSLQYVRDDAPGNGGPSVFGALADLGLKLENRQAPVEVFVIDSATRPAQN